MTEADTEANAPKMSDDSIATRQSLLCRLRNTADEASWREFFDTYWNLIYRVARKAGLSDAEAQDVIQETVISVARRIEGFVYDPRVCSFKTWMLRLTRWRISNRLKARHRDVAHFHESLPSGDTTRTPTIESIPDSVSDQPDENWDHEWQRNILETALERTKQRVNPAHYQIYDLCVHEQKPAWEVARALEVSVGRVYLARHRVTAVLKAELARLEREIERKERGGTGARHQA
jgi:RNA polymerase sigma factor (sigma-70 family)